MRFDRRALIGVLGLALAIVAGVALSRLDRPEPAEPPAEPCDLRAGLPRRAPASTPVRVVASGLCAPWGIAFLPDGSALVVERETARVLSLTGDGRIREVLRLGDARADGEGGLLGIAVPPTYSADGWIFVYYTTAVDNRIARFRLGAAAEPVFTGIPAHTVHNGGRIAFGPDGMLYAGTGDADRADGAQDRMFLGGKILRMTPQGRPAPGNPYRDSPVWSLGHRDVQGLAWDGRGRLYASESGEGGPAELNLIRAGGNYGWPHSGGTGMDPASSTRSRPGHRRRRRAGSPCSATRRTWPVRPASGSTGSGWTARRARRCWSVSTGDCGTSRGLRTARCGYSRPTGTDREFPTPTTTSSCASASEPDAPGKISRSRSTDAALVAEGVRANRPVSSGTHDP